MFEKDTSTDARPGASAGRRGARLRGMARIGAAVAASGTVAGALLLAGGPAFAAIGTANSTGTRLFCLSGCVQRPGLYEHEFGITLREVIEAAGGRCAPCCSAARPARSSAPTRSTRR